MSPARRTFLRATAGALCLTRFAKIATAATIVRRPYIQRLLADRVTALWTTAQPGSGTVIVISPDGKTSSFSAVMATYAPAVTQLTSTFYQFQAEITGLQPGVRYRYQVYSDSQLVAGDFFLNSFRTAAKEDFSFLVFGDSGEDTTAQLTMIQKMSAETGISKVIHVGDLAYDSGTFQQLEDNYFTLNSGLMSYLPFFTTPGNHEYRTSSAGPYLAGHAAPASAVPVPAGDLGRYYSYDWGDAHFVSVDSNLLDDDVAARMLAWLDADLAATSQYWKIVFMHHPAYPTGTHINDAICGLVRGTMMPIMEKRGVQLVLSGHEHGYERSFPLVGGVRKDVTVPSTTYIITGGGGAELHKVGSLPQCALSIPVYNYLRIGIAGTTLTLQAMGIDGYEIDRVTLSPPPMLTAEGVVSSGDYTRSIAPGSLVSLFGQNLALRTLAVTAFPLSNQVDEISVTSNGVPTPILFASPSQINIQLPFEVSGPVDIKVTTLNGTITTRVTVMPTAPAILVVVSGAKVNSATNPAAAGSYVVLYLTGLGATERRVPTGQPAPGVPISVIAPVQISIGDTQLQPLYAGLAPGFAGLDQINFQVPSTVANGTVALRVTANGVVSKPVNLIVGPAPAAPIAALKPELEYAFA